MSRRFDVQDNTGIVERIANRGSLQAYGLGAPTASARGFAPSCLYHDLTNGSLYQNVGTYASATWTLLATAAAGAVNGIAAGYKLARGIETVTGTATVSTGLTTVVAVTATMQADASLTNGIAVTATIGDQAGTPDPGSFILSVWKPTASGDVTPIASAAAVAVNWIAIGT